MFYELSMPFPIKGRSYYYFPSISKATVFLEEHGDEIPPGIHLVNLILCGSASLLSVLCDLLNEEPVIVSRLEVIRSFYIEQGDRLIIV